jgi:zinc protease
MSSLALRVAAIVTVVLFGACTTTEAPRYALKHAERRGRFANGLRFVLMPDPTTQMVEVDIRYDVGSRDDPPGKAGLAHLVEHLMFQQRPDGPTTPPLMESINDLSTFFNAYTDWDNTHYMTSARADRLDALLKIEAIRLFYGCQTISQAEFEREREVVRNEIRQRSGTATGQIPRLLLSAVYPKGHAYERPIGGDDQQLSTATLEDACGFIARYYAPERATLIVAGGLDIDPAVASIENWFARIAKREPAPRAKVQPIQLAPGKVVLSLDVERPSVHVVWALPARNTPESDAVQFGLASTLFRIAEKADEYEFAYDVDADELGGQLAPVFVISLALKDIGKVDQAIAFVRKSAKSAYRGFDEGSRDEIEELQNRRKASYIASLEPLMARTHELADLVQRSDVDFDSRDVYLFHELDKFGRFDGKRVASAIKQYLDFDRARIVVVRPSKEGIKGDLRSSVRLATRSDDHIELADVDPADADRPIELTAELKGLTGAARFTLDNGLKVVILPIKSMPLVSARLIFDNAGGALTPDDPALGYAAPSLLFAPMDATAFRRTGVRLRCGAGPDAATCVSSGINIYAGIVIRSLERMVSVGTYDQTSIEHWQRNLREQFDARARQDAELSRQELIAIYGPDHPYTRTGALTPDAADKLHLDSLNRFRRAHYSAGNATLVVVGDIDPAAIEHDVRDSFGRWSRGTVDPPIGVPAQARSQPVVVGVVGKDLAQLRVIIAYPAPAGVDDQAAARAVLTEMLNLRVSALRFKLGSTYGVYARHGIRKGPTSYELGGDVDSERGGESIKAMRDGVTALRKGEQFNEDFVRARRKLVSDLLGESTVTAELAARLGFIATHGLAPDYYRTLLQRLASVTPAQVHALVDKELDPSREAIIVLGDRQHLGSAFAGAGLTGARLVEPADH